MPYRLEITTTSPSIDKRSAVFESILETHNYLTTAMEIWNGHWEGWGEFDLPPTAPAMMTLSMIDTTPSLILNVEYIDGFKVSVIGSKTD